MEKEHKIGRIAGLQLSFEPLFIVGTIIFWLPLSGVGIWMLDLPFPKAAAGALIAALLYWLSEIVHQLGHAYAAHRTGDPMVGIRLGKYLFFSTSIYPENEQVLPGEIHIRRALGGPMMSLALTVLSGSTAVILFPIQGVLWWMVMFVCFINLLVFTIGSFLPLGFTDGSTLLKWRGRR